MRRLFIICLLALSATALVVSVPAAPAAKKKEAAKPSITRVMPMRISVGARLTILGKNFKASAKDNTVVFRAPNGRSAFAKPRSASRGKLVVVVPGAVSRLLGGSQSSPKPTRMKLRILAGKFSAFTTRRLSPVVTGFGSGDGPGGGSGAPAPSGSGGSGGTGGGGGSCGGGSDWDGDLIDNALEAQIKTNPCAKDSDGDGVEDGFEYKSAIDLNDDEFQDPNQTLPYPGKRPYPNALDPSDADTDFDGDVLTLAEEQRLWHYTGVRLLFDLTYSDGEQYSIRTRDENNRRVPALAAAGYVKHTDFLNWATGAGYRTVQLSDGAPWWMHGTTGNAYGLLDFNRDGVETAVLLPDYSRPETTYYDFDTNGRLSDNERDEDADGLTNYDETHGRMTPDYWAACYGMEAPHPVPYAGTDLADPDSDGDGVRDGADDQDHDDVPNVAELSRRAASGHWDAKTQCRVDPDLDSGSFAVSGGPLPNTSVIVTFVGELGRQDVPEMTASGASLVGGSVSVSTIRDGDGATNEVQVVTLSGPPTDGSFTLSFGSDTTSAIGFDATAEAVESALDTMLPTDPASHHSGDYGRVNPFNPCLPAVWSRTCTLHPGFENAGAPFDQSPNWYALN